MDESYAIRRYEQAAALLPLRWQQQARQLPPRQISAMRSMIFKETPSLFPGIYALSCPLRAGIYKKFLPG